MARAEQAMIGTAAREEQSELAHQWRRLTRAATLVAVLTSPAVFVWFTGVLGWGTAWSLVATFLSVIAFRGFIDVVFRRFIPWPSLFAAEGRIVEEDVVARRRAWYWRTKWRRALVFATFLATVNTVVYLIADLTGNAIGWWSVPGRAAEAIKPFLPLLLLYGFQLPMLFFVNLIILFGPLLFFSLTQIKGYEPGDADWGVRLDDVRGQAEAKEEVRRVVALWQSGEAFERAGGKRERGLLFLGAPGTGKTMLAKAIATGFNCPFVTIPGSGFAQTFIGMDALIVRYLARKAKKLAAKWGGQCIVFIDEIDAVGLRRQTLGTGAPTGATAANATIHDLCFFGPNGALTPTGDLVLESRAWRDRLFAERESAPPRAPSLLGRLGGTVQMMFPGMMGGGSQGLQQLLIVMDGIGDPPFGKRLLTNRLNTFLDACYVVPRRIGRLRLRLPRPRPASEQIYFIGACNVPIEALDPALTRPGRMGRHVWFRTPTKVDRKDIFDLYLAKVSHEPDLDAPRRREELARITNGYSPAMIEQVCSMALTHAHHDGRQAFGWTDIVDAMTTVESGTAVSVEYVEDETRAIAIHEAGHAACAHVFVPGLESTRLSIRKRGGSLGHHQAMQKEERFTAWRHEKMGELVWTLGAMAAEYVFYEENSTGVGGDVQSVTANAALMVGYSGMGPERVDLDGRFPLATDEDAARERIMGRFEQIGKTIMRRSGGGGPMGNDPIAGVLGDGEKRAAAAQILGQAYVVAYNFIVQNREAVAHIADVLVERREMYGDEVVELLDEVRLRPPEIDLLSERSWPKL